MSIEPAPSVAEASPIARPAGSDTVHTTLGDPKAMLVTIRRRLRTAMFACVTIIGRVADLLSQLGI